MVVRFFIYQTLFSPKYKFIVDATEHGGMKNRIMLIHVKNVPRKKVNAVGREPIVNGPTKSVSLTKVSHLFLIDYL